MRILIITTHIDSIGGIEEYCRTIVKVLQRLGHDVEVWSMFDPPSGNEPGPNIKYLSPENKLGMRAYFRLRTPHVLQLLARKAGQFDLVLAMHVMAVPALYWASLLRRDLEYWVWVHGSEVWGHIQYDVARGLARAGKIVSVSEYTANILQDAVSLVEKPLVIYPPVDTRWFVPAPENHGSNDSLTLLTVGRIDDHGICYKGQDVVIRALRAVHSKTGKRVEYRVVGSGTRVDYLKALAREQGVFEAVSFLGSVGKDELRKEYRGCDLFIMPSRMERLSNGYVTGEGFGIAYAEAAACGKPVVGSRHGGAAEAVLDGITGYLVNPSSVDEVIEATCSILGDPDKAEKMGRAGRHFVERNFSVDVFCERIAALLRSG